MTINGSSKNQPESPCLFREEQHLHQWWLTLLLVVLAVVPTFLFGYAMYKQFIQGQPWGDRPMSDTALAITGPLVILTGWGVVFLVRWMSLLVEVQESAVLIRFRPFVRRKILFHDIRTCEERTYHPIREYGGWGIRFGKAGRAYNVSGNRGVQLELVDGKRILIGSLRSAELAHAIQEQMKKHAEDDSDSRNI
jgi:hypothetical protein